MGAIMSSLETTVYGKKKLPILMVGRGYAGKSTILHQFTHGEFIQINAATIGFDAEPVEYKDVSFLFSEVGGQLKGMATLWKHYSGNTPALIFVVDSNDRDRITEARNELHYYMNEIKVSEKHASILVYANKQDLPSAMSVTEITHKLDLHSLGRHYWHVQAASAVTGEGLYDGLDWLYRHLLPSLEVEIFRNRQHRLALRSRHQSLVTSHSMPPSSIQRVQLLRIEKFNKICFFFFFLVLFCRYTDGAMLIENPRRSNHDVETEPEV